MIDKSGVLFFFLAIIIFPWMGFPGYGYLFILSFILAMLPLGKVKLKSFDFLILLFVFCFLFFNILYFQYSTAVILYVTFIVFVFIIRNDAINYPVNYKYLSIIIMLSFVLVSFSWHESVHSGRYSIFVGDPNFSGYILFVLLSSLFLLSNNRLYDVSILLLLIGCFWLTQSRMIFVCLILSFLVKYFLPIILNNRVKFVGGLLIISAVWQGVFYVAFSAFSDYFLINFPLLTGRWNLADTSNLLRFELYHNVMLSSFSSWDSFIFGDFEKYSKIDYRPPHNWFAMSFSLFGGVFTLAFSYAVFRVFFIIEERLIPLYTNVVFMSSVLNLTVLLFGCLFLLLVNRFFDRRVTI
ncbi:hypothetical protein AB6E23_10590 [Vibrio cyclitrophicus]